MLTLLSRIKKLHDELGLPFKTAELQTTTQQSFITELLVWCLNKDLDSESSTRYKYESKNMTWAHQIKSVINSMKSRQRSGFNFESRLKTLLTALKIECLPGLSRGKLTSRQWLHIIAIPDASLIERRPVGLESYTVQTPSDVSGIAIRKPHLSIGNELFPLTIPTQQFTSGLDAYRKQYFNGKSEKQQMIGNVLMRFGEAVDMTIPFHRLLMTMGHFLQLRIRLPWAECLDINRALSSKTFADHPEGRMRDRWLFMFVFVPLYYKSKIRHCEQGPGEATTDQLYKAVMGEIPTLTTLTRRATEDLHSSFGTSRYTNQSIRI